MTIKKAVIPVAGLGTRFLPATKAVPKEMFPILDKPLVQYVIEEAIEAGINEFILVTREDKGAIEEHFKRSIELENVLIEKGKKHLLEKVNPAFFDNISISSIIQPKPLGLGHAVLCARDLVGDQSFAVILPDDLIENEDKGCLRQMVEVYFEKQCGIIAVENVSPDETDKYGIVSIELPGKSISRITGIIEKPKPEVAPTTLAVVGRYILPSQIFTCLEKTARGSDGEVQLTDAIAKLIKDNEVIAYEFCGTRYDCGSKLGYLQANIEYGLKDKQIKKELSEFVNKRN